MAKVLELPKEIDLLFQMVKHHKKESRAHQKKARHTMGYIEKLCKENGLNFEIEKRKAKSNDRHSREDGQTTVGVIDRG